MRRLALFCGGFAAGIFLAQYLLPDGWLLSVGVACLGAGFAALLLPERQRKRAVLCLTGMALALGWNWLYIRQVSAPMERLADSQQTLTMTLTEYPVEPGSEQGDGAGGGAAGKADLLRRSASFAARSRPADHG